MVRFEKGDTVEYDATVLRNGRIRKIRRKGVVIDSWGYYDRTTAYFGQASKEGTVYLVKTQTGKQEAIRPRLDRMTRIRGVKRRR